MGHRGQVADSPGALLGPAQLSDRDLTAIARAVSGRPGALLRCWWVEPVDYLIGTATTAGLLRVRGIVDDCAGSWLWSAFVKLLRSHRSAELSASLPARLLERVLMSAAADLSWRHEADVYLAGLDEVLPPGLRLPARYRVDDLGQGRIAEWLEDVQTAPACWDVPRFARAARLLGRLAVRLTHSDRLPDSVSHVPGEVLRLQHVGNEIFTLPALLGDAIWAHPHLAASADPNLRDDLHRLVAQVPAILDAFDRLPQTFMHGDASPQNLLVSADDPDGFVAIDWSLIGLAAVGYDLSQLLIGLAHAGQLDVDALPTVHDAVLPAYTAGLADEGMRVDEGIVRFGFHAALVVRSAFSALPLHQLAGPPDRGNAALVASRLRLTRYLLDLGLALPEAGP